MRHCDTRENSDPESSNLLLKPAWAGLSTPPWHYVLPLSAASHTPSFAFHYITSSWLCACLPPWLLVLSTLCEVLVLISKQCLQLCPTYRNPYWTWSVVMAHLNTASIHSLGHDLHPPLFSLGVSLWWPHPLPGFIYHLYIHSSAMYIFSLVLCFETWLNTAKSNAYFHGSHINLSSSKR